VNEALFAIDPEIAGLCAKELSRLSSCVQLIPSENFPSVAVMQAQGSVFTVKYAEGYPGRRYYGGYQVVDQLEPVVVERAKSLFSAEHANVQPHAGATANMCVYFALLQPGDTVMAMQLDQGGHLTHGSPVNFSGQLYDFVAYGVDPVTELIDMDDVAKKARECRPKMIVAGATAYPRIPDFEAFREVADEVGALLMVDMAHFAGMVAGGSHPSPVPWSDVVTTTTHKSLRGPRGALILCKERYAAAIDKTVMPGIQGGPFMHAIAAKGVCLREAASPSFSDYAQQIVRNAKALAEGLLAEGFRLVSGGTDTHLILADVRPFGVRGKEAQLALDEAGITCNRNTIPFDPEKPFIGSGLRFGTPAVTTQGMKEPQMAVIARLIGRVLRDMSRPGFESVASSVRDEVAALCSSFPPYPELSS
jgi:glycine hydroxymethyltransferase